MSCGKKSYLNRSHAAHDSDVVNRKSSRGHVQPYWCRECQSWHVGNNKAKSRWPYKRRHDKVPLE